MKQTIYIAVINDLVTDQRLQRIAETLSLAGTEVILTGRKLPGSFTFNPTAYRAHRMKLLFNKGFLFYAFFNIRLFLYLLTRRKIDFLVANDLDTLPACYLVSVLRNKKLIFDSHELFTEVPELNGRNFVKKFWGTIEKSILPRIQWAYTVNDSLAEIYARKYNVHFETIRNLPPLKRITGSYRLPEKLAANKIVLYQGAVNIGRGIEDVIQVVRQIPGVVFVIAGEGDIYHDIRLFVEREKLHNIIHLTGKLPPETLRGLTLKADLGVSLEKNISLNYYYALPNKIFDYIHAGIPVLASDFPEMQKIIRGYHIGLTVDPEDIAGVKEKMKMMLFDEEKRKVWKSNTSKAIEELNWEIEQTKLISLYTKAGLISGAHNEYKPQTN